LFVLRERHELEPGAGVSAKVRAAKKVARGQKGDRKELKPGLDRWKSAQGHLPSDLAICDPKQDPQAAIAHERPKRTLDPGRGNEDRVVRAADERAHAEQRRWRTQRDARGRREVPALIADRKIERLEAALRSDRRVKGAVFGVLDGRDLCVV